MKKYTRNNKVKKNVFSQQTSQGQRHGKFVREVDALQVLTPSANICCRQWNSRSFPQSRLHTFLCGKFVQEIQHVFAPTRSCLHSATPRIRGSVTFGFKYHSYLADFETIISATKKRLSAQSICSRKQTNFHFIASCVRGKKCYHGVGFGILVIWKFVL